jgi:hypothetical protein
MQNGDDEEIIDKICDYATKYQVKELLQEYLKRIVVDKPADPVAYLIQSIQENPFTIGPATEETD